MNDLAEALRKETEQTDHAKIEVAYLERNGKISVIPRKGKPQVLDVSVADGVQTVRLEVK
jgi:uncharacterized membrane protein YcaP (DUF421 family)